MTELFKKNKELELKLKERKQKLSEILELEEGIELLRKQRKRLINEERLKEEEKWNNRMPAEGLWGNKEVRKSKRVQRKNELQEKIKMLKEEKKERMEELKMLQISPVKMLRNLWKRRDEKLEQEIEELQKQISESYKGIENLFDEQIKGQ